MATPVHVTVCAANSKDLCVSLSERFLKHLYLKHRRTTAFFSKYEHFAFLSNFGKMTWPSFNFQDKSSFSAGDKKAVSAIVSSFKGSEGIFMSQFQHWFVVKKHLRKKRGVSETDHEKKKGKLSKNRKGV